MRNRRFGAVAVSALLAVLVAGACSGSRPGRPAAPPRPTQVPRTGIHKIRHIVVVMQENRSFDNYFGTFPGADGIPMKNGVPTVCVPDIGQLPCVRPFVDHQDVNGGGPHQYVNAKSDIDNGNMDGFVQQARDAEHTCATFGDPACVATLL